MNKFKVVYFIGYTCRQAVTGWQVFEAAVWKPFTVIKKRKKENNYLLKVHNETKLST